MNYPSSVRLAIYRNQELRKWPELSRLDQMSLSRSARRPRTAEDIRRDYENLHEASKEFVAVHHLVREVKILRDLGKRHVP